MKIEQYCHFTLGCPCDTAYLVSPKVHNFFRKCLRSTASPLCSRYASIFEDESLKAQIILCPTGAYSTKIPHFGPSVGHRLQTIPFCFLLLREGIQVLLYALTRKFFPYKCFNESKSLTNFLLCSEEICCIVTVNYLWNSPNGYKTTNGGHARVLTQGTCYFEMNRSANKTSEEANIPFFHVSFFYYFERSNEINAERSERIMIIISISEPVGRQTDHVRL